MARSKKHGEQKKNNGGNVGYEAALWQMADALWPRARRHVPMPLN